MPARYAGRDDRDAIESAAAWPDRDLPASVWGL
jgi:hypothetical protein